MRKFRALFRSIASNESMLTLAFRFRGIVKPAPDRKMKTGFWRTWEFSLTHDEVDQLRAEFGFSLGTDADGTKAITAYILNEIRGREYVLFRVDDITEPMPADATPTPHKHECSAYCPLHKPGNPQLSDPWARGY